MLLQTGESFFAQVVNQIIMLILEWKITRQLTLHLVENTAKKGSSRSSDRYVRLPCCPLSPHFRTTAESNTK